MIIHLGNPTRAEVISSVLGQLSDGIWENSSAMDKYWMFADVDGTNLSIDDEAFRDETGWGRYGSTRKRTQNGFYGKSEKEIKDWFANKAKQVVKIWAEDYGKDHKAVWDRNNTDEVTYMGHHNMDITVADVYECYDFLKGRSGKKYGITEAPAPIEVAEVSEPEVSGGMNPSQQEVEDFFLDASTRTRGRSIKASRRTFTKYPSNYVKAYTVPAVGPGQMDDWKSICRALAKKVNGTLLFVNESSCGIEFPDGSMRHIYLDEVEDYL